MHDNSQRADFPFTNSEQEFLMIAFPAGTRDLEKQKENWILYGPSANRTMEYISLLDENDPILPRWFFYLGWRIEYECAKKGAEMIQMILDDKI